MLLGCIQLSCQLSCWRAGLQGPKVVSSDCHAVRVWDAATGNGFTTIEAPDPSINDVLLWPDSGLVMLGCDARHIQASRWPADTADTRCMLAAAAAARSSSSIKLAACAIMLQHGAEIGRTACCLH